MCGRYVLVMRPSQARKYLEDHHMPVHDAPADDADDALRQSYNFAPGYFGAVYRAERPAHDASADSTHAAPPQRGPAGEGENTRYKLQSMKWGLVPSWTKRNPNYGSMLKTINCRADSLASPGGLWGSVKGRKRCVVVADGFFEWLKVGPKEKVPHYVRRADGQPMLFAGLWDCVRFEDSDERLYTYTVITVDSNPQLKFLHDRMPAILEPSPAELSTWLDPSRTSWTSELQNMLRPSSAQLDVYPVSKDVGKVGNNSPSFVIPVASKENKANIANFFANASKKAALSSSPAALVAKNEGGDEVKKEMEESRPTAAKRPASPPLKAAEPPAKIPATSPRKGKLSATNNGTRPPRGSQEGSHKITSFFTKAG